MRKNDEAKRRNADSRQIMRGLDALALLEVALRGAPLLHLAHRLGDERLDNAGKLLRLLPAVAALVKVADERGGCRALNRLPRVAAQPRRDDVWITYPSKAQGAKHGALTVGYGTKGEDSIGPEFGFGHAVLRAEDPRATIQYELGKQICPDDELFQTAGAMRERAVKVLSEEEKISNPYPNVDAVSGTLLNASGLTDSDYYTVLFGFSRIAGISAQIIDERNNLRNGKGVAIYRCSYNCLLYTSPSPRDS